MITKEELEGWENDPTTKKVFEEIKEILVAQTEMIVTGRTLSDHVYTARVVGQIEGLRKVLNISCEEEAREEVENETAPE